MTFRIPKSVRAIARCAWAVIVAGSFPTPAPAACISFEPGAYWPNGVVPYSFDGNISTPNRERLREAMDVWENAARVRFVSHDQEDHWIHFRSDTYDGADIGRQAVGFQTVHIHSWTEKFAMVHIIGHALGLGDEHQREDSSDYLVLHEDNWDSDRVGEHFEGELVLENWPLSIADYDLESVMHPTECAFSKCADCPSDPSDCRTITVRSPNQALQSRIGRVEQLSKTDARMISLLYPEPDWVVVNFHLRSGINQPQNGTLIEPFIYVDRGLEAVPEGGTLWLAPAKYDFRGVIDQKVTLRCPFTDHHPAVSSPTAAVLGLQP